MMTPRSALFLAAAVALAIVMFPAASAVSAQEDTTPFGALSCSSNFGNPAEQKLFSLAAASPAEIVSLQKSKPALSAGPSAGGKFPYDGVDVYLAEKDLGADDPEESVVTLYVRAVRNQKESWFAIVHERTDIPGSDFFMRTRSDTSPEDEIDRENDAGPAVSLALKNNDISIFEFSWWRREVGASTSAAVQKILLLDFRTLHPSVLAVLQCIAAGAAESVAFTIMAMLRPPCFRAIEMPRNRTSCSLPAKLATSLRRYVSLLSGQRHRRALYGERRRTSDAKRGRCVGHLNALTNKTRCSGTGPCDHPWTIRSDWRTRNGGAARIAR